MRNAHRLFLLQFKSPLSLPGALRSLNRRKESGSMLSVETIKLGTNSLTTLTGYVVVICRIQDPN